MSDNQNDVPNVCMETQTDRIARKHARQLARRRVRAIEEIKGELEEERNAHSARMHEERMRHTNRIAELWKELSRYNAQVDAPSGARSAE